MIAPERVRCSPLGRKERVAEVVDVIPDADTRGRRDQLVVDVDGHRFRVLASDAEAV